MDKLLKYQSAIMSILEAYSTIKYDNIDGENQIIADKERHRYQIVTIGWSGNQFIHDCPLHFDIIKDKIWIQKNMTEWDVGRMLEEKGIPKSNIVIGFLSPTTRAYSNYAIN